MKRIYPEYTYTVVPIVLGATGLVTNSLVQNLRTLGFNNDGEMTELVAEAADEGPCWVNEDCEICDGTKVVRSCTLW